MPTEVSIAVRIGEDGKTPTRALIVDGTMVTYLSKVAVIELIMQATSTLRFEPDTADYPR